LIESYIESYIELSRRDINVHQCTRVIIQIRCIQIKQTSVIKQNLL